MSRSGLEPETACVLDRRDNHLHQRDPVGSRSGTASTFQAVLLCLAQIGLYGEAGGLECRVHLGPNRGPSKDNVGKEWYRQNCQIAQVW